MWDVRSGQVLQVYQGHEAAVTGLAFNSQATQFLTISADNTMRLWDVESGDLIRAFEGHSDDVLDVVLARSGDVAITASADGTAKVWRISLSSIVRWIENNRYIRALTEEEILEYRLDLSESE
ncbi:MAG: hypothetical protein Q9P44_16560 [Anaerolineae bacterium]|nr:hypothetical protein [Anaerolineae bacterium]